MDKVALTRWVREIAISLGFDSIGFSRAEFMDAEARNLETWLNQDKHGKMSYMQRYFDLRTDPSRLVPNAKTVISFSFNYYTGRSKSDPEAPNVSRYAYGKDYHGVLKKKLKIILNSLHEKIGSFDGRCFVDSAPVLERDWARRSGIGWIGKNTMLIHPKKGSYFFLAEIILDVEFEFDVPMRDYCGTCRKCIEACPTDAISPNGYQLDARKCISYLTIELREDIPKSFSGKMKNWVFGCDICQEVCPWNRFSVEHEEPEFGPNQELLSMQKRDWEEITEEVFRKVFKGSAIKRAKFSGIKRNLKFLEND